MTCKDAIDLLADFLDRSLPCDAGDALEAHLRECAPCQAYLNTYRETVGLLTRSGRVEMPAELKTRLRQFLLERLTR